MNFPMIDETLEAYLNLEKKFVRAMLQKSVSAKSQSSDFTRDVFDEMCLVIDKVAKRVSKQLYHPHF